ncbi:MAG: hypothetical protein DRI77_11150 [Chloroflexi bacterium]|nr:MAG: hypothetical protein DRI77_11150 [Chloroflexota bacterium]
MSPRHARRPRTIPPSQWIRGSGIGGATEPPALVSPGPARLLLVAFFAFGIAAWTEENLFRCYLQPLLARSVSLWMAIVILPERLKM